MEKLPLIEFSGVTKSFGKRKIISDISFRIDKGDIFGLLGRSGSGKTTLLKMLLGSIRPDSGKILFRGKNITGDSFFLRKIIGLTTQENSFYDKLTVYENMIYYSRLYDVSLPKQGLESRIRNILKEVELEGSSKTVSEKLSGGMKRRLDFAISLVHDPELLILDEPTTGLDPILVNQFWEIIRRFSKNGKTILVISHIFPEVKANCNRAGILDKGKLKIIGITEKTDLFREFSEAVR
jgi:ABC-2 type transport system ATP-binding protein